MRFGLAGRTSRSRCSFPEPMILAGVLAESGEFQCNIAKRSRLVADPQPWSEPTSVTRIDALVAVSEGSRSVDIR